MKAAYSEAGLTLDSRGATILTYPIPKRLKTEPIYCSENSCCGIALNANRPTF